MLNTNSYQKSNFFYFFVALFSSIFTFGQTVATYSTNGTWTCPPGVTSVQVEVWGAGGGGGGAFFGNGYNVAGGGGGGGAYSKTTNVVVTPGTNYNITVGTGGTGGILSGTKGGDGNSSSAIGVSANGGIGGQNGNGVNTPYVVAGVGGNGGTTGGAGVIKFAGGKGADAIYGTNLKSGGGGGGAGNAAAGGAANTVANNASGGVGGNVGGGNGANGNYSTTNFAGLVGSNPGGGGSGSISTSSYQIGGKGGDGKVIITYYAAPTITNISPIGICLGQSFTITGTDFYNITSITIGGTAISSSNYVVNSTTSITVTPVAVVSGTVTVTTSRGSATSSSVVSVNNKPVVNNMTGTVCSGNQFTVTPQNSTNGTIPTGTTYAWSAPTVTGGLTGGTAGNGGSITGTLTNSTSTVQTATYVVTPISGSCSGNTFNVVVSVNPNLPASVSISSNLGTTICSGTSVIFKATPTNGGSSPTYQWMLNDSPITGATSSSYITSTLANGNTISVVMTSNATPCLTGSPATSNIIKMTVNPLPTASVSGNGYSCSGSDALFNITGTSGSLVTYNINGGANSSITLNSSGTSQVKLTSVITDQVFNIVSVSNGTCTSSVGGKATVSVGASSVYSNGNWSKGIPSNNGLSAVIGSDYNTSSGSFIACSCNVNAGATLTISPSTYAEVVGNIINSGNIIVESDGNLIQKTDGATFTGNDITVKRNINVSAARNQYNYMISPTINGNLKTEIFRDQSNTKINSPSVQYYTENNSRFGESSGAYIPGRGLAVKEPTTGTAPYAAVFVGKPANGIVSFNAVNSDNTNTARGFNLVGNPFPSNIDIVKFYTDNGGEAANLSSTFYFWDNIGNTTSAQQGSGYSGNAYATYNAVSLTGTKATADAGASNKIPDRYVKVGQGFMAKITVPTKTLEFRNDIRTDKSSTSFFGRGNTESRDRFWLNLISPTNVASNIAIVYFSGGNNGFAADDSRSLGGSDVLYSLVDNEKLSINGRSSFLNTDVVPLGSKHFTNGNYTIAIDKAEGVFANGQNVYLKDKQTGIITNLSEGSYSFNANAGEFTGRFEIVYKSQTMMGAGGTAKDQLMVYRDGSQFVVKSDIRKITAIEIFDSSGKMIYKNTVNKNTVEIDANNLVNGVYILKIYRNNEVSTRKIIR